MPILYKPVDPLLINRPAAQVLTSVYCNAQALRHASQCVLFTGENRSMMKSASQEHNGYCVYGVGEVHLSMETSPNLNGHDLKGHWHKMFELYLFLTDMPIALKSLSRLPVWLAPNLVIKKLSIHCTSRSKGLLVPKLLVLIVFNRTIGPHFMNFPSLVQVTPNVQLTSLTW